MKRIGIDSRYQGDRSEIRKRYGNTLMGLIRKIYGRSIAQEFSDEATLSEALSMTPDAALRAIYQDHHSGVLAAKIEQAKVEEAISRPRRR